MNDLRNQAAERGANYVQHDSPQLGHSGSDGDSTTTTATVSGTAYECSQRSAVASRPAAAQAQLPAAAAAPSPAPAARPPQPWSARTPEGHKELKLIVSGGAVRIGLRGVPALSRAVSLHAMVRGGTAPASCELRLASNGERVALAAPPEDAAAIDPAQKTPVRAHAVIAIDALETMASAERVAGRVCDDEFVLSAEQIRALHDYVLQFQETLALLPETDTAPASSAQATGSATPGAASSPSPAGAAAP